MDTILSYGNHIYHLRYTINSICAMEELAGVSLDRASEKVFGFARLILWGALLDCHPDITLSQTGDLITDYVKCGGEMDSIMHLCATALDEAGFF